MDATDPISNGPAPAADDAAAVETATGSAAATVGPGAAVEREGAGSPSAAPAAASAAPAGGPPSNPTGGAAMPKSTSTGSIASVGSGGEEPAVAATPTNGATTQAATAPAGQEAANKVAPDADLPESRPTSPDEAGDLGDSEVPRPPQG